MYNKGGVGPEGTQITKVCTNVHTCMYICHLAPPPPRSQFYPPKQLTNVLTGLPSFHLIVRTMIVKFILNSLTQQDSSSARILQIEETPNHEFFPQVYDTKMFLLWKLKYLNEKTGKPFPTSVRKLNLLKLINQT